MLRALEIMLREMLRIVSELDPTVVKLKEKRTDNDDVIKEVVEEVIRIKKEALRNNDVVERVTHGVALLLGLDKDRLLEEVLKLEGCLVEQCTRQDEIVAIEDRVERIAEILSDAESWDAYSSSPGPSAYRYAAAVVLWLLLAKYHLGGLIRSDCPVFDDAVAATIAHFLASRYAKPVADALDRALRCRRQEDIVSLCIYKSR